MSNNFRLSEFRESSTGCANEIADTSFGGVASWGSSWALRDGPVEVAVRWHTEISGAQDMDVFISLQERLEGSGLGSGEEETEGDKGGFHYFNLFLIGN